VKIYDILSLLVQIYKKLRGKKADREFQVLKTTVEGIFEKIADYEIRLPGKGRDMKTNEILDRLAQPYKKLCGEERALRTTVEGILGKITDDETRRLEVYSALARLRLDEFVAGTVSRDLGIVEQQAKAKYDTFKQHCARIQKERGALEKDIAQVESQRSAIVREIGTSLDEIAALKNGVRERLMGDESWTKSEAQTHALEAKLTAAKGKAQAREAERASKSQPYLDDKLFKYLFDRHYGTAQYRGGTLTRWGDNFVARTIHYEAARRNFTLLNELPERLREHLNGLEHALEAQRKALAKRYRDEMVNAGIVPLEQKLGKQRADLESTEKTGQTLQDKLTQNHKSYHDLTEGDAGDGLNAVLAMTATALQKTGLAALEKRARETDTPEDDRLVNELADLNSRIAEERNHLEEPREKLRTIGKLTAELAMAIDGIRKTYSGDASFSGGDTPIIALIEGILDGTGEYDSLRAYLKKHYVPPRSESSSSSGGKSFWDLLADLDTGSGSSRRSRDFDTSSGSSRSSSSSSGGGFGGGGFSSGGKSGGGGFKTGGGF
jgi:chromosome segregation ATPase